MGDYTKGAVPILLPDQYKKRAIKNVIAIKGFVLRATAPYGTIRAKQYWVWDEKAGQEMPRYKTKTLPKANPEVKAGDCVLYNSYNIAHVFVQGLPDPLVIIREIDMFTVWDPKDDATIELGDHSIKSLFQTKEDFNV